MERESPWARPLTALALLTMVAAPLLGLALAAEPRGEAGGAARGELPGAVQGPVPRGATAASPPTFDGPYDGPTDAAGVGAACPGPVASEADCYTVVLERLLAARGSEAAFGVLDEMSRNSVEVNLAAHPIAHDMGAYALEVYGSINETLRTCSYKVFQGCFHGALQAHFLALPRIDAAALQGICATSDAFRSYVCLHGLGHGLMLATGYDLNRSLELCDHTDSPSGADYAHTSCQGGIYMENLAGWSEAQLPAGSAHHHHDAPVPQRFWVDRADLSFPCDAVASTYQWACWFFQTSVILTLNGGDLGDASHRCAQLAGTLLDACFRSLGRDVAGYKNEDIPASAAVCTQAVEEGQGPCVRGLVANVVTFYASPESGLPVCKQVPAQLKQACYTELAVQGRSIAPARMAEVCAQAEADYVQGCRADAGVA